jgi:flagellar L-ring protein precursor FlgH
MAIFQVNRYCNQTAGVSRQFVNRCSAAVRQVLILTSVLLITGCANTNRAPAAKEPGIFVPQPAPSSVSGVDGAIYSNKSNRFLFEDNKARRVGDVITVLLDEQTNATKSASTNTNKNTAIGLANPTLFGREPTFRGKPALSASVSADHAFSGAGGSSQSNRLSGDITVTIAEVYPNGNMMIKGEKLVTLNQGSEVISITGLVRAADVSPLNTITSNRIANAKITYRGRGALADSNRPGWLTRILGGVLWPF